MEGSGNMKLNHMIQDKHFMLPELKLETQPLTVTMILNFTSHVTWNQSWLTWNKYHGTWYVGMFTRKQLYVTWKRSLRDTHDLLTFTSFVVKKTKVLTGGSTP